MQRRLEQKLNSSLCNESLKRELKQCCEQLGLQTMRLASGAGHDCMNYRNICPTAMIFVRSQHEGASHCREEYSTKEDCRDGCQLLLEALRKDL